MSYLSIRGHHVGQSRRAWRWLRSGVRDSRYMADPEWLIGVGRLATAAFAGIAIDLDPAQPGRLAVEARLLILAYTAFSLLSLIPIRWPLDRRMHVLTHAVDIIVIGALLHLTDELTSPFFAFFHFMLFAATIRWGMTGALRGAATRLDLAVTLREGVLQLGIAGNGTGLAGDNDRDTPLPLSLGARVADLAGRLSIVRQRPGFALLIESPAT